MPTDHELIDNLLKDYPTRSGSRPVRAAAQIAPNRRGLSPRLSLAFQDFARTCPVAPSVAPAPPVTPYRRFFIALLSFAHVSPVSTSAPFGKTCLNETASSTCPCAFTL